MVVNNMGVWMAMFATALTDIQPDNAQERTRVVNTYKLSLAEFSVRKPLPAIVVDDDCSEFGALWSSPAEAIIIEDKHEELAADWVKPADPITIDDDKINPHGIWMNPTFWGD